MPRVERRCGAAAVALAACCLCAASVAAETWGGSFAFTSDYLVRGISRSNHAGALQADLHLASDGGLLGGLFASNVQFDSGDTRNAELSGFLGYAWQRAGAWRAKAIAAYYSYLWNDSGSHYNYTEVSLEASYDDWLDLGATYSPNAPRYVEQSGLIGVTGTSAEVNVRTPWRHHVALTAGLGYAELAGSGGGGYAYWSAGTVLDLAPWSISLSFVDTGSKAQALFFAAAARQRWTATAIWHF